MPQEKPGVSIVILNWNGLDDTIECIESLQKVTYPNFEVIVIDNASNGDDVRVLNERFGSYITLIENKKNYGCGEGYNSGIRYALNKGGSKYIITMNNDVTLDPAFMDELVRVAESDGKIGIVGPKIFYYDYNGRNDVILDAGGKIHKWSLKIHRRIGESQDDLPQYQIQKEVDWVTGAVLMFKGHLIDKVGFWSDWYFIGYEDVEFCLKTSKQGYKVVYVPTAVAWHKVAVSLKKAGLDQPNLSNYYHLIKECFPLYLYIYHRLLLPVTLCRWAFLYLIKYRKRYSMRGFVSGLSSRLLGRDRQSQWRNS